MERTVENLNIYLEVYHENSSLSSDENLFYTVSHEQKHPLSHDCIGKFIKKYGEQARKVCAEVPKNVHPHLWRHSRAMHLYQEGMDLTLVSQWLDHKDLKTTLVYAHADTEQKRRAIETATKKSEALSKQLNPHRFKVSDEEQLKRLYGLK